MSRAIRVLLALLILPTQGFAQARSAVNVVVPEIQLSPIASPNLSVPSIGIPSLPSGLAVPGNLLTAPSIQPSPLPSAVAFKAAVPVKAAVPAALAPTTSVKAAASAPDKPANASVPAEQSKSEAARLFDGALNVLVAGSEAVPFIKTGGLADVVDAVSRGLAARGHSVTLVLPFYKQLKPGSLELSEAGEVAVPIGDRVEKAKMLVGERAGVKVVLLKHPEFYERDGGPYAPKNAPASPAIAYSSYDAQGGDDADERFGFYARAALEAAKALGFKPDVVHAHDWHAAMIPTFLKTAYKDDAFFAGTKSMLTIHNIAFQGAFSLATAGKLGVPEAALEHMGGANYLKSGIEHADVVTTVSPTYAREIVENPVYGMGMEKPLRARGEGGVKGVINGIDPELYDPATDPEIAAHYSIDTAAEGKAANKTAMQKKLGLDEKADAPLFVVASRLAHQKGIDMIYESAKDIVAAGGQLAIMGSGDEKTEKIRADLVKAFPGKIASHPFDETAVRLLFAAADFLLMPSRFEPCGLSQLIAQRYGTIPLVTSIGGLADTVVDLRDDPLNGTGLFVRAQASISLSRTIADAIQGYRHPEAFALARRAAMSKDSSWEVSLDVYLALFRKVLNPTGPDALSAGIKPAPSIGDRPAEETRKPDGWWKRYKASRGKHPLANLFGTSLFLASMGAAAVPALWGAVPALKAAFLLAAADAGLALIVPPVMIGLWIWRKAARQPQTASKPPPSRRLKLAVLALGMSLGLVAGGAPYLASGPITEKIGVYTDSGKPTEERQNARWISGDAVHDETEKVLSANPIGRRVLDSLRDRGGALRLPPFFISTQKDSHAEHESLFGGVYLNVENVLQNGWTVEEFLADPAKQRQLIREMHATVLHELVHEDQGRRAPWTPGYFANTLEAEEEAFYTQMLYQLARLEADPAARNNGHDQWLIPDAAEDVEKFLRFVDGMYPDNKRVPSAHLDALLAEHRANPAAFRVRAYTALAARATGPGTAKMYMKLAEKAAAEAGLPAPEPLE